jgi:hypothetical protein
MTQQQAPSLMVTSALENATSVAHGRELNAECVGLLNGWAFNADPKHPDLPRVRARVHEYYEHTAGTTPAAHLDVYTPVSPGASAQGRSAVASLAEQMGHAYIAPKGKA